MGGTFESMMDKIERLEAERDRYREALERITEAYDATRHRPSASDLHCLAIKSLRIYVRDDGATAHMALSKFEGAEAVEVVPAERLAGAVEDAAKWEALARRLYRLWGEDAERLVPGDVELLTEGDS